MNKSIYNYDELYLEMNEKLDTLSEAATSPHQAVEDSLTVIQEYLNRLKEQVTTDAFPSQEDEVSFFKKTKPRFQSQLIYYAKVLQLILKWPPAGKESVERFLRRELKKLEYFFRKQSFLYEYLRSDASFLDEQLFIRGKAISIKTELYGVDVDSRFTTGHDYTIAKIKAYDFLRVYLEKELRKLNDEDLLTSLNEPVGLVWTASKRALIELLYGLQSCGVFNNGNAALNDVASALERILNIKLGNYYRVFQEIRIRKKGRTQFIDEMKERLLQKMDYTDENPHIG